MAAEKKKSQTGSRETAARKKNTNTGQKKKTQSNASHKASQKQEETFTLEVLLWIVVALSILLFISNFGFGGKIGNAVSSFFFGVFGLLAYVFPVIFLVGIFFGVSNKGSAVATVKLVAGVLFVAFLSMFIQMAITGEFVMTPAEAYAYGKEHTVSGGIIGGFLTWLMLPNFGVAGSYVIDIVILIISMVLLTERSALRWMEKGSRKVYESARNENERRREYVMQRREEREQQREERYLRRMDKKAEGVAMDIKILPEQKDSRSDEISELYAPEDVIIPEIKEERHITVVPSVPSVQEPEYAKAAAIVPPQPEEDSIRSLENVLKEEMSGFGYGSVVSPVYQDEITAEPDVFIEESDDFMEEIDGFVEEPDDFIEEAEFGASAGNEPVDVDIENEGIDGIEDIDTVPEPVMPKPYQMPPTSLLTKPKPQAGDSKQQLQATAIKLQQTLKNFGVNVTITNISCGPTVTRYELQPEMGVKVHKIVNLTDDIKLNLAATDIRMEAPIPGKAAIGIEVPNKETVMVSFRELVESQEFMSHDSKIAVAVGRDIGGNVVVTDIAKMPHVLIAGATGAGKSVCINTIIMSILYKAKPDEVKLIMIDPKVVELSVYNGIPHLLIPVVTDPKKAAGALNWAVDEMTDRYNKFAECGVRDFKGYNAKIDALPEIEGETKPEKMTQIVIIVDELADLMMVASGEVEGAICRLAQLARAAGIHLIIATQRPSVNVITGLIKANMPSRIAFAVTSGIDSRTILDTVGAEKLLGKGDMLFSPYGAPKPMRVQGAFVSDNEVTEVVKFIKEENGQGSYSPDIEEKVNNAEVANTTVTLDSGSGGGDGRDTYFKDAAKLLIDKQKGSIGMLQRYFKIGFNRAARIMDQLEEAGIVGPEEGTKPRQILMTEEEFAQYVEECL